MKSSEKRIALLIDCENIGAKNIGYIIEELAVYGNIDIKRAYGNWDGHRLSGWKKKLDEYAIRTMHQYDMVKGKNSTDIVLVIDAMEILFTNNIDIFVLVTSDCDFVSLAIRLREQGKEVICFGLQKTPKAFASACSEFIAIEDLQKENGTYVDGLSRKRLREDTKLVNLLRKAAEKKKNADGWAPLRECRKYLKYDKDEHIKTTYGIETPEGLEELVRKSELFRIRESDGDLLLRDARLDAEEEQRACSSKPMSTKNPAHLSQHQVPA